MKKTWFPQLIAAFILAAVAGLYLVPQTLSAEEMNQIVGACECNEAKKRDCRQKDDGGTVIVYVNRCSGLNATKICEKTLRYPCPIGSMLREAEEQKCNNR